MEKSKNRTKTSAFQKRLELLAYQNGADFFGIADLSPAREFMVNQGGEMVGQFPLGISLGMRISDTIVDTHSPDEKHGTQPLLVACL